MCNMKALARFLFEKLWSRLKFYCLPIRCRWGRKGYFINYLDILLSLLKKKRYPPIPNSNINCQIHCHINVKIVPMCSAYLKSLVDVMGDILNAGLFAINNLRIVGAARWRTSILSYFVLNRKEEQDKSSDSRNSHPSATANKAIHCLK